MKGFLADFDVVRSHPITTCEKSDLFSSESLQTGDGRYVLTRYKGQHEIQIKRFKTIHSFAEHSSELLGFLHDENGKQF